ncbi:fumarylacetoacetate hydrolase family protein [Planctomycetota bacterium]
MKLITYQKDNAISCGILIKDQIIDIPTAWQGTNPPHSIKEILKKGQPSLDKLTKLIDSKNQLIPLDSVKLLAPIPRPGKVIALAGNYAEHIIEGGLKLGMSDSPRETTTPRPFLMPSTVIAAPNEQIPWPVFSKTIDYEIELAIVIGKKAKCLNSKEALDCIAGYTIANDVSARTITFDQNRDKRPWDEFYDWLNGKWADAFLPMGPYLLTADEVEDPQNLDMTLTINGGIRQQANTKQMIYSVADTVSFVSHLMTLEPGDVIATGTPAGVGDATGLYLESGDRIDCNIEKLGTLTNMLGQKPQSFYEPLA